MSTHNENPDTPRSAEEQVLVVPMSIEEAIELVKRERDWRREYGKIVAPQRMLADAMDVLLKAYEAQHATPASEPLLEIAHIIRECADVLRHANYCFIPARLHKCADRLSTPTTPVPRNLANIYEFEQFLEITEAAEQRIAAMPMPQGIDMSDVLEPEPLEEQ